jgi:hypothetical protein
MFSILSFVKGKFKITGSPCPVCVCPTFYFGKDGRFFSEFAMDLMLMNGFPTSSVQLHTVDKDIMVVTQTYEVERHNVS